MKILFTLFIALLAFTAVAQHNFEILTSIATKGKKQGLYDVVQNKWISPLSNQFVFDLGNDFYGTYDKKTRSIQGIFHNKSFTKKTNLENELIITERIEWYEYSVYEMGGWSFTNNGAAAGRSSFNYAEKSHSSIGIVPISNFLLVGQSIGKGICDLTIVETKKGNQIKQFRNVKWRLDENKLYVAHCKLSQEGNVTVNKPIKVEVYTVLDGELSLTKTMKKDTTDQYNQLATWITEDALFYHPDPNKSHDGIAKNFAAFYATDFKKDSSEKYSFIQDLGEFVIFANETGAWVKSPRQLWLKIGNTLHYDEHHYEQNTFKGVALIGDLLVTKSAEAASSIQLIDPMYGEPMYDEVGNPIYADYPGENNSGIWNIKTKSWIINPEYYNLSIINNKIIADHIQYEVDAKTGYLISQTESLKVFNLAGNSLHEFNKDQLKELFSKIYEADSLTELQGRYVSYHKDGMSNLVDISYFLVDGRPNEILTFEDSLIAGTFNLEGSSSVSLSQGNFFYNVNLPELGNYQFKINQSFFGRGTRNIETWENEWITSENKSNKTIASGIEKYGDYSIIRNVSQTEVLDLAYLDEEGFQVYDEFGDIEFMQEITKGHYNTGLWDNLNNKWLLQPSYEDIIITKNGFTALLRTDYYTDWVDYLGYNRTRLDSTTTDYLVFDSNFNFKTQFSENVMPWSNPKYLEYLSLSEPVLSTIQHPKKVHEGTSAYSGKYTWVKTEKGFSMFDINGFARTTIQLISDAQWLHESNDILYYIKNDTLNIRHRDAAANNSYKIEIEGNMSVIDCNKYLQLVQNQDTSYYNLQKDLSVYKDKKPMDLSWDSKYLDLMITENSITALNPLVETIESYGEYDDYFYALDLKISDDLVWVKENNNWDVKLATAHIKDFKTGYYVDSNYVSDAGWDYSIDLENQNNYTFYYPNLTPIKELKDYKFVSTKVDHGLTIVEYIGEFGFNSLAIFDTKGNLMSHDIYYYEIENNTIICTPIDPVYGEDLIDENGDFPKYTFPLE